MLSLNSLLKTVGLLLLFLCNPKHLASQDFDQQLQELTQKMIKSFETRDSVLYLSLLATPEMMWSMAKDAARKNDELDEEDLDKEKLDSMSNAFREMERKYSFGRMADRLSKLGIELIPDHFQVISSQGDRPPSTIHRVVAPLQHERFQFFSFRVGEYKGKLYLPVGSPQLMKKDLFYRSRTYNETTIIKGEKGTIAASGTVYLQQTEATGLELYDILVKAKRVLGARDQDRNAEKPWVSGVLKAQYHLENDTVAGNIDLHFKFEFDRGKIHYQFYDLTHEQGISSYATVGLMPYKYKKRAAAVFTEEEYELLHIRIHEHVRDILMNYQKLINWSTK